MSQNPDSQPPEEPTNGTPGPSSGKSNGTTNGARGPQPHHSHTDKPAEWGSTPPAAPDLTLSSVFRIDDLDHLAGLAEGIAPGYLYARDGHPNADRLGRKLAELDHAEAAVVCGSGMGAISALLLDRLGPGDRVLASAELYGKTRTLLGKRFASFGVQTEMVRIDDMEGIRQKLATRPSLLWVEGLSNPLLRVARIDELAQAARSQGTLLVVDATFTPPPMLRPLTLGADLVLHSLTKILSGHADVTAGSLAGRRELIESVRETASVFGLHAAAMDCWLTERGLATLELRYERAAANALALADRLLAMRRIRAVHYPGLPSHPDHDWLMTHARGFGTMLAFELDGGRDAVNRLFQNLQSVPFCPSLGDTRTSVSYPAQTSHQSLTAEEQRELGISAGLVRVSVGVEPIEEIVADFDQALASI